MRAIILFFVVSIFIFTQSFAQDLKIGLPMGHSNWIRGIEFSANGAYVLTYGQDGNIFLWEARSGRIVKKHFPGTGAILSASFSKDSSIVFRVQGELQFQNLNLRTGIKSGSPDFTIVPQKLSIPKYIDERVFLEYNPVTGHLKTSLKANTSFEPYTRTIQKGAVIDDLIDEEKQVLYYVSRNRFISYDLLQEKETTLLAINGVEKVFKHPARWLYIIYYSEGRIASFNPLTRELVPISSKERPDLELNPVFSPLNDVVAVRNTNNSVSLVNLNNGIIEQTLRGQMLHLNTGDVSPTNPFIAVGAWNGDVRVINFSENKVIFNSPAHTSFCRSVQFSPDGATLFSAGYDSTVVLHHLRDEKPPMIYNHHKEWVETARFSSSGLMGISSGWDKKTVIFNIATGRVIRRIKSKSLNIFGNVRGINQASAFSHNDSFYIIHREDKRKLYTGTLRSGKKDLRVMKLDTTIKYAGALVTSFTNAPCTDRWAALSHLGKIGLFKGTVADPYGYVYFPGATGIKMLCHDRLAAFDLHKIVLFNTETQQIIWQLVDSAASFHFITGSENYLIAGSNSGILSFYDIANGILKFTTFVFEDESSLTLLPSGYYMGDVSAVAKMHFVDGMKTIGFEQLDVKYNRPDLVLAAINPGVPEMLPLVEAMGKAYQKRIKKLGIDTTLLFDRRYIPTSVITNKVEILQSRNDSVIVLKIKLSDLKYALNAIHVKINGVPLFSRTGINIAMRHTRECDTTIRVRLGQGINKIVVSVDNEAGLESFRDEVYCSWYPAKPPGARVWYVGIGVSEYTTAANNLVYASKDVQNLGDQIKQKYPGSSIHLLLNKDATLKNIRKLKDDVLSLTSEDDIVIFSFSGHGIVDDSLDFYLAAHDVDFEKPARKGISYDIVEWILDSIPARKKLMLIDACHSGELDKEEYRRILTMAKGAKGSPVVPKGLEEMVEEEVNVGLKNSFTLMQEMFTGVSRSNGATVISAAAGTEFAFEGEDWGNGVFTYAVIQGLVKGEADHDKDGEINVSELKKYVSRQVQLLTKGLQRPTARQENLDNEWVIW